MQWSKEVSFVPQLLCQSKNKVPSSIHECMCTGECVSVHRNRLLERKTESELGSIGPEQPGGEHACCLDPALAYPMHQSQRCPARKFCTQKDAAALSCYFPCLILIVSHFLVCSFPTFELKLDWDTSTEMGRKMCLQMTHPGKDIVILHHFTQYSPFRQELFFQFGKVRKQTLEFREAKSQSW